eukprot:gb/GECG01001425.1/.p1 GENE.gb/GECG01001425.1/~~gb/GECG01001425.1/.p1  ORF type:complete len:450 (+),score=44.15 gb/GECG01001425.1/:1-1350(+)
MAYEDKDGTEGISEETERAFLDWFHAHGGRHPKIQYPSRETINGVRGAVAVEDIESEEVMITVPRKLMISSEDCNACPYLNPVFEGLPEIFQDEDMKLAFFLVNEKLKGHQSFWAAYLSMLPRPLTICEWSSEELEQLQDTQLVDRSHRRAVTLRNTFNNAKIAIEAKFPEHLNWSHFSLPNFLWAWRTIQARAFGRFLPWTALVPFADCLNHANVPVKYSYDSNCNFLMRPTKSNRYPKGQEVYNSYGRRDNKHLLLEYGFCLLNNEWEYIDFPVSPYTCLSPSKNRLELLRLASYSKSTIKLYWNKFGEQLLLYYRLQHIPEHFLEEGLAWKAWSQPLTLESEMAALSRMRADIQGWIDQFPTSLDYDLGLLQACSEGHTSIALNYRITRKRILQQQLEWIDGLRPLVEKLQNSLRECVGDGKGGLPSKEPAEKYLKSLFEHYHEKR